MSNKNDNLIKRSEIERAIKGTGQYRNRSNTSKVFKDTIEELKAAQKQVEQETINDFGKTIANVFDNDLDKTQEFLDKLSKMSEEDINKFFSINEETNSKNENNDQQIV